MSRPLWRRRYALKRGLLAISLLVLIIWLGTIRWCFGYVCGDKGWYVRCATGGIEVQVCKSCMDRWPPDDWFISSWDWELVKSGASRKEVRPFLRDKLGLRMPRRVEILPNTRLAKHYRWFPLWPLFLLPAVGTVVLYWRHRPRPGLCRNCRYNLTGNVSGVCPECGTEVPTL